VRRRSPGPARRPAGGAAPGPGGGDRLIERLRAGAGPPGAAAAVA
jgi:hypothetical protein